MSARAGKLQRDVLVPIAPVWGLGQCLRDLAAGVRRVDLLVDHTDLDRQIHSAGDAFVLGGQRKSSPIR